MVPVETTEEFDWLDLLGLETDGLFCCLGKKEEAEVALVVGDVSESLLASVFQVED